jgi:hypothetical protein
MLRFTANQRTGGSITKRPAGAVLRRTLPGPASRPSASRRPEATSVGLSYTCGPRASSSSFCNRSRSGPMRGNHAPDERLTELAGYLTFVEQIEEDIARLKVRLEHIDNPRLRRIVLDDIARLKARRSAELLRIVTQLREHVDLAGRLDLVQSVPGIGERSALALIVRMPEIGRVSLEEAAALAGLAPFDDDSGTHNGISPGDRGASAAPCTLRHCRPHSVGTKPSSNSMPASKRAEKPTTPPSLHAPESSSSTPTPSSSAEHRGSKNLSLRSLMGTSNNCHRSSGAPNLPTNDSALFSFRFCAVHLKDVRDSQLRQLFEVPLCLANKADCETRIGLVGIRLLLRRADRDKNCRFLSISPGMFRRGPFCTVGRIGFLLAAILPVPIVPSIDAGNVVRLRKIAGDQNVSWLICWALSPVSRCSTSGSPSVERGSQECVSLGENKR